MQTMPGRDHEMVANTEEAANDAVAMRNGGRRKLLLIIVAGLLLTGVTAVLLRVIYPKQAPLWGVLPSGADLYLYVDLEELQENPAVRWYLSDGPGIPASKPDQENETRRFVEATGLQYQKDLRELAAARRGENWVGAARVSADRTRLENYLKSRAASSAQIAGITTYSYGSARPLKVGFVSDDLLVFAIGSGEDGLVDAMLLLAKPPESNAALESITRGMKPDSAAKLRTLATRPLWLAARGENLFGNSAESEGPSWGGFLLGKETLSGIEALFVSAESSTLALQMDGQFLMNEGVDPQPLANNLNLLSSLMRPKAPPQGERDLRPLWDALQISAQQSSVTIRWHATPQMLSQVASQKP